MKELGQSSLYMIKLASAFSLCAALFLFVWEMDLYAFGAFLFSMVAVYYLNRHGVAYGERKDLAKIGMTIAVVGAIFASILFVSGAILS